jgi:hypothetical protein
MKLSEEIEFTYMDGLCGLVKLIDEGFEGIEPKGIKKILGSLHPWI